MGRRALIAAALIAVAAAIIAAGASAVPIEVTYHFSSGGPKSKVQKGITGLGFFTVTEDGKTVEVSPEEFEGAEDESPGRAAIALSIEATCENRAAGLSTVDTVDYFVRRGRFGTKPLPVRHDRFTYQGPAFDGHASAGKIKVSGRFTKRGTIAIGTVLVRGGKTTGPEGESLTGCHTGKGARPRALSYRLIGEI